MKGDIDLGSESIYFLVIAFFLAVISLMFVNNIHIMQNALLKNQVDVKDTMLLEKAVSCFSKREDVKIKDLEAKRIYKGIIDLNLVNKENVESCLGDAEVEIIESSKLGEKTIEVFGSDVKADKKIGTVEKPIVNVERIILVEINNKLEKRILKVRK